MPHRALPAAEPLGLLTIHQVQDEAEFVRCVKGVSHADNEGTVLERMNTSLRRTEAAPETIPTTKHPTADSYSFSLALSVTCTGHFRNHGARDPADDRDRHRPSEQLNSRHSLTLTQPGVALFRASRDAAAPLASAGHSLGSG